MAYNSRHEARFHLEIRMYVSIKNANHFTIIYHRILDMDLEEKYEDEKSI